MMIILGCLLVPGHSYQIPSPAQAILRGVAAQARRVFSFVQPFVLVLEKNRKIKDEGDRLGE
jgi:hypothetical protein